MLLIIGNLYFTATCGFIQRLLQFVAQLLDFFLLLSVDLVAVVRQRGIDLRDEALGAVARLDVFLALVVLSLALFRLACGRSLLRSGRWSSGW